MIRPSTRLFGLVMSDPRVEGHVTRIYNYLLGFNGLDAAYLSFVLRPEALEVAMKGFVDTGRCEALHVAPVHQRGVARWLLRPEPVDTVSVVGGRAKAGLAEPDPAKWLDPDAVLARACADLERWFGITPHVPPDWRAVVTESAFRPCQLTSPREPHAARRPT